MTFEKTMEVFVNRVTGMAAEDVFEELLFEVAVAELRAAVKEEVRANHAATLRANTRAEARDNEYAYLTSFMEEEKTEEIPPPR